MSRADSHPEAAPSGDPWFTTTHWTTVLTAGGPDSPAARQALEKLCRAYWYPLYAYARRRGHGVEDAQDLTQEFFARLLEKNFLAAADPIKGRFRGFLCAAFQRFLCNEWDKAQRLKRGGGGVMVSWEEINAEGRYHQEPAHDRTAENLFERSWAMTLLAAALDETRQEYHAAGKARLFDTLQRCLTGEADLPAYAAFAAELNMTAAAVKMAVLRLRRRYGELVRAHIAHTVARPEEIEEEVHHLLAVVAG